MKALIAALIGLMLLATMPAEAAGVARPKNIAIVLYEHAEVLDFAGPAEVFSAAANFAGQFGEPVRVYTVAKTTAPIKAQGFISITPEYSIADAPPADIVVIPGGPSSNFTNDAEAMKWLEKNIGTAQVTLTVCTGAFALAKTGALDGLNVTTWYGALDRLQIEAPKSHVISGTRFIDNDRYVTTAGVSAGIDGSLHVVARIFGRQIADQTARYMEYHWTPEPYLAKKYQYLDPSTTESGRTIQLAGMQDADGHPEIALQLLQNLVKEHADDARAWYALGMVAHKQKNYATSMDAFTRAASSEQFRRAAWVNAAASAALARKTEAAAAYLQKAVDAGLKNPEVITTDDDFAEVQNDPQIKLIVAKMSSPSASR